MTRLFVAAMCAAVLSLPSAARQITSPPPPQTPTKTSLEAVVVPTAAAAIPISVIEPAYSDAGRAANIEGSVIIALDVATTGVPSNITVVRPLGFGLDEKAVEAVSQWRFQPAMSCDIPIPAHITIPVKFTLAQRSSPQRRDLMSRLNTPPAPPDSQLHAENRFSLPPYLLRGAALETCNGTQSWITATNLICGFSAQQGTDVQQRTAVFTFDVTSTSTLVGFSLIACKVENSSCVPQGSSVAQWELQRLNDQFLSHLVRQMNVYGCSSEFIANHVRGSE